MLRERERERGSTLDDGKKGCREPRERLKKRKRMGRNGEKAVLATCSTSRRSCCFLAKMPANDIWGGKKNISPIKEKGKMWVEIMPLMFHSTRSDISKRGSQEILEKACSDSSFISFSGCDEWSRFKRDI